MLSPIILFVYNRPEHTQKTLESLKNNDLADKSELFIFCDGPKDDATQEQKEKIQAVRNLIKSQAWCGRVNIIEKEKNMGLANSVISGVTEIIDKFGKVIVLEDDLILSKFFLTYMNDALDKFENEEKVMQISGYMFPIEIKEKIDAFFLPFTSSWGWATWKRAWDSFDYNLTIHDIKALEDDKQLRYKFDLNGSYPYFGMLKSQFDSKIDSWAIRFYLSIFLKNGLVLYPAKTLVHNIGFDGSGVHCKSELIQGEINNILKINRYDSIAINENIKNVTFAFLKKQSSLMQKVYVFLKKTICMQ